jgi:hypothetical protein
MAQQNHDGDDREAVQHLKLSMCCLTIDDVSQCTHNVHLSYGVVLADVGNNSCCPQVTKRHVRQVNGDLSHGLKGIRSFLCLS